LAKAACGAVDDLMEHVKDVSGVKVIAEQVTVTDMKRLRQLLDELKDKLTSSVIVLAADVDGKVLLAATGSDEIITRNIHAGKLIGDVAAICGGGGGGRRNVAQAGGKDPSKIGEALQQVSTYVDSNIS